MSFASPANELCPLTSFENSGGLGLTGGIVDVGNLFDCLYGIYENKASDDILFKYNDVRRDKYLNVVDPISSSNLRRLFESDPETVIDSDEFFQMCEKAKTDKDFARQLQLVC